jgi:hypothetical protein
MRAHFSESLLKTMAVHTATLPVYLFIYLLVYLATLSFAQVV